MYRVRGAVCYSPARGPCGGCGMEQIDALVDAEHLQQHGQAEIRRWCSGLVKW